MNQTDFTYILQQPQKVTKEQTDDLKSIISEFPYFQSARAMYLKGLKNSESFKYNQALKSTAAYTTDRSILFDFITSKEFQQNEVSQFIKQNTSYVNDIEVTLEDISINKSVKIDEALNKQIEDTKEVLDPTLFQPKIEKKQIANFKLKSTETTEEATSLKEDQTLSPKELLSLGKPLQFEKTENHSFNEWLTLTRLKPIQREETNTINKDTEETNALERAKKFELIEQFINKSPKLKPTKTKATNHNIAKEQMIQPEALMTETLARIYVEQKNYKKAIQSYKILSLKYPEKSGFFADQIKAVKQLQEQNNIE